MRTGLVKTKVSAIRMPALRSPTSKTRKSVAKGKKLTLTFADAVNVQKDS